ncbi:RNase A-like domain-containing protein [Ochrovirga pacifica]|uniref:RNase A-like domain-containing protein n=1 Tax=Ochrovirga pacifica TaxID=1042376 RepID=UPI0002558E56|nr:RNase A-like domain-containing protein [Ochrovirga pacifica]
MKKILFIIGSLFFLLASFNKASDDCDLVLKKVIDELNNHPKLAEAVKENPKLVDAWKKLDDLGADNALKNDPKVLDYVNSGRKNEINLDVEEVLGGHSKFRHGSHLTYNDMKLRVLNKHPDFPQSRSALKFDSDAVHQDAVNKAFKHHKSSIESHFSSSDDYLTLEYDYGSKVGSGYTNTGSRNNPVAEHVESNKVVIALKRDSTNPDGYILDSAYPSLN